MKSLLYFLCHIFNVLIKPESGVGSEQALKDQFSVEVVNEKPFETIVFYAQD